VKISLRVLYRRGLDEHVAIEIAQEKLGAGLGAVDADNAKVLRSDGLNAVSELTLRLLDQEASRLFGTTGTNHETPPWIVKTSSEGSMANGSFF
jgi:hypothetical protein